MAEISVSESLAFHSLPEKIDKARGIDKGGYLAHPFELYQQLLTTLAQSMDRAIQPEAIETLRKNIMGTGISLGKSPEERKAIKNERDGYRKTYQEALSAREALNQVLKSEKADERYQEGRKGGSDKIDLEGIDFTGFPYPKIKPELRALHIVDPNLLNSRIIDHAFYSHLRGARSLREAFRRAEMPRGHWAYRLALLARLELDTKRLMIRPVARRIVVLNESEAQAETQSLDQKKQVFERLMLGNRQARDWPARKGTEFFRGFLETIHLGYAKTLNKVPEPERERVLKLIQNVSLMRTSEKKYDQTGIELRSSVLSFISQGDYDGAEHQLKQLKMQNPKLFPDFFEKIFPITPQEREEFEKPLREKERAEQEHREKVETERKAVAQADWQARRDPELKVKIDPYIGQAFTDPETNERFVVEGFTSKKLSKDGPPQPGYVKIVKDTFREGHEVRRQSAVFNYENFLKYMEMVLEPQA